MSSGKFCIEDLVNFTKEGDLKLLGQMQLNNISRHILPFCFERCECKCLAYLAMGHANATMRGCAMKTLFCVLMVHSPKLTSVDIPTLIAIEKILRPRKSSVLIGMCHQDTEGVEIYLEVYHLVISFVYIVIVAGRHDFVYDLDEEACRHVLEVLSQFKTDVHARFPSRKHCFRFRFLEQLLGKNTLPRQSAKPIAERKQGSRANLLGKLHLLVDSNAESTAQDTSLHEFLQVFSKMGPADQHTFYMYTCFLVS